MARKKDDIPYRELEVIRKENHGVLRPEDVVIAAGPVDHPLHTHFEWNDKKAGQEHRLWQARQLIRTVTMILPEVEQPIHAYVSLRGDRTYEGGGYRSVVDVMSDTEMRKALLDEALDDLTLWQRKYQELDALIPVFDAIGKVKKASRKPALKTTEPKSSTKKPREPVPA